MVLVCIFHICMWNIEKIKANEVCLIFSVFGLSYGCSDSLTKLMHVRKLKAADQELHNRLLKVIKQKRKIKLRKEKNRKRR